MTAYNCFSIKLKFLQVFNGLVIPYCLMHPKGVSIMHPPKNILSTALTCLLAMSMTAPAASAYAESKEKCFGVAKAGQNACNTNKSKHSCAGHSNVDNDPSDYISLPLGTCLKIGGKLEPSNENTASDNNV